MLYLASIMHCAAAPLRLRENTIVNAIMNIFVVYILRSQSRKNTIGDHDRSLCSAIKQGI